MTAVLLKRRLSLLLILLLCLVTTQTARANVGYVSDGKAAAVIIGVVAAGVLIGLGVYFAVHRGHSLRGCASGEAGNLRLLNEGDQQTYSLLGSVNGIHPGDRIRVSGNKEKAGGPAREFEVTKITKEYGQCKVQP
jgi:hypothetical protein